MLTYIEISKIDAHPDNPRKDLGDLTELAESIKLNGILQNLTVVPWFSAITRAPADDGKMDGYYRAVIGHRRLAAAKLAGLTEVPCVISDMGPKEQVATMLLENMQRNDLTVYEQAQGFQMMLNFGDTVNSIAEKTGFSETTVRRRVKLLELDQEKFEKSVVRGGTLQDYAELNKIEDITLRNGVLDKIGTSNFTWELQKAIDKEKREKVAAAIVTELEKFATRIEDSAGLQTVKHYYTSQEPAVEIPDDADNKEYFFIPSEYGYITLYTKGIPTPLPVNESAVAKGKEIQERRAALEEISKRAYQLRCDFIKKVPNTQAKTCMSAIAESLIDTLLGGYHNLDDGEYAEFLGIDGYEDKDGELQFDITELVGNQPERHLLIISWLLIDGENEHYFDWHAQHHDNKDLNKIYTLLEKLGYEMSDEERQLQDGTHELFAVKE